MTQGTLPFAKGSATSREAAASARSKADQNRERVLRAITEAGERGMTCDEVEVALGGSHQAISPRVCELAQRGVIVDTGTTRATRSGPRYQAVVYRVKP